MEAQPLQIITLGPQNTITLDEETLARILTNDEIKDRYVSVISITGAFRQGKSFLLNFLLRYLRIKYVEKRDVNDNWLLPEDGPLKGFVWSPGSKRNTTGIIMWSEIFLADLPSKEKVAIILLDTQGAFDNQSTVGDCAKFFALSTLISSVQIYNVMRNIKQYDFGHLHCFGSYGKLLLNFDEVPFHDLCILVRDWACAYEHPYGNGGGSAFLEEVMHSDEPEIQQQIQNVNTLFKKISCFLLPYPGRPVDTSKSFNGDLNEIDEEFKVHVQDFVNNLLSPENLVLKTVGGRKVTAEALLCFIKEYCTALKDGELPPVETLFKATVEAHHKSASQQAFKLYKKNMSADVKYHPRYFTENDLYDRHASNKVTAVDFYANMKKFEDESVYDKYLVHLKDSCDGEYKLFRKINEEKKRKYEEKKREYEESKRRMEENIRRTRGASTSGMSTLSTGETLGLAAGIIGGAAALAFGASKFLSNSRGNND